MHNLFNLKSERSQSLFWGILGIFSMSVFILSNLYIGQSLVLYGFALILAFCSVMMYPTSGLCILIVCTMWFERHFTLAPLAVNGAFIKLYPIDFIILFLAVSVLIRMIFGGWKIKFKNLDKFILLFGVICTAGFVIAIFRHLDLALAFGTYKNYFLYAVVYFLAIIILRAEDDWRRVMNWFAAGGLGLIFFLAYGLVTGNGLWSEFTPLSTSGSRLIAGTHTFYFVLFLFWLIAVRLWRKIQKDAKWFDNIWPLLAMSLATGALVVSLVRHLWVAVAFVLLFWLAFLPGIKMRLRYLLIIFLTAAISAVWLFGYYYSENILRAGGTSQHVSAAQVLKERTDIEYVTSMRDSSFRWRVSTWQTGFYSWAINPIFGTGLGYQISGFDNNWPFTVALREIHNDYLAILFQLGMVGFMIVGLWFVYLVYEFFKNRKILSGPEIFRSRLLFFSWSAIIILMAGFSISIYWDINLFVIWWWLALAAFRFCTEEHL